MESMNILPRTFCVSLRETPKRREEALKYFEKVLILDKFYNYKI